MIDVARQLGHRADLTVKTYGHVIAELEDRPSLSAEAAVKEAREAVSGGVGTRLVPATAGDAQGTNNFPLQH